VPPKMDKRSKGSGLIQEGTELTGRRFGSGKGKRDNRDAHSTGPPMTAPKGCSKRALTQTGCARSWHQGRQQNKHTHEKGIRNVNRLHIRSFRNRVKGGV